jgi:nitrogen regulatory protein PII
LLNNSMDIELICVIVNFGLGSKIIKTAKQCGVTGATIAIGKGTVDNRVLDYLGLSNIRKEVVIMVAEKNTAYQALETISKKFMFNKPHHGIAFTTSINRVLGANRLACPVNNIEREVTGHMYHAITTIVDRGKAEDVIDAATKAGSKGGTIINARGSGIHETSKLFSMDIEPEKEIVIILSEVESTEKIVSSIRSHLKIDEPGNGIIFIQDVNKTYGIYR